MATSTGNPYIFEGLRWLAWGLVVSLVPFGLAYAFFFYQMGGPPTVATIFGSGQAFPTGFAMFAVAIKELQGPRLHRVWYADVLAFVAVVSLIAIGSAYGYLTSSRLSSVPQTQEQLDLIGDATVVVLIMGALTACFSTAAGANLKYQASIGGR